MIYAKHIGDFTFDRMPIVWELAITAHWTGELLILFRITLKFFVNYQTGRIWKTITCYVIENTNWANDPSSGMNCLDYH